jgi:hypothetical protein
VSLNTAGQVADTPFTDERLRAKNNTCWMDLVRLAFDKAPDEARAIMREIRRVDLEITRATGALAK